MSSDTRSGTGRDAPLDTGGSSTSELPASQPHGQGAPPPRKARCRYFGQPSGCRSGASCPFRHETVDTAQRSTAAVQQQPVHGPQPSPPPTQTSGAGESPVAPPGSTAGRVNTPRITSRPVPQSQLADPRAYQLSQLRRRFTPAEHNENSSTILTFRMRPSDPDFPYPLEALHCSLRIPSDYPNGGKPTLGVTNPDMERGYQINIECGFDRIVASAKSATLLACLNSLDRELESLLSSQKADTIKIVQHSKKLAQDNIAPHYPVGSHAQAPALPHPVPQLRPKSPEYSAEQRSQARDARESQVRQLETRMGRLPQFVRSTDGLAFTVPIEPRKRGELPIELQALKIVKLIVPESYNLTPCRIELVGVTGEAVRCVEEAFQLRTAQEPTVSLFQQINYLSQNIRIMAKQQQRIKEASPLERTPAQAEHSEWSQSLPLRNDQQSQKRAEVSDRPHVITIPRPPEWDVSNNAAAEDSDTSSESNDNDDVEDSEVTGHASASGNASLPERGVLISFPHLDLHGIELLEIVALCIIVKCDRCKDSKDVTNLQDNSDGTHARQDSCKKCASPLTIGYRPEPLHVNSIRAGYLDLVGCAIVDLLPSSFIPTCADCSTTYARPGVTSGRGEVSIAFCRSCHRKMTFGLPEVKFLRTSASTAVRASQGPIRKKKPESLGIVAGQELPNRGRCSHYKKSYRWFRFSCCNRVYPCDRCHDETADHVLEHANRMICGFCSREQNYRPKDCGICHAWLTVRPGKGFWEGGQGTRDTTKMSRKDPRKYKRAKGSKPSS
ncbi:hypothetical protein K491DRAFT_697336 [Lophiostoma macrostomum CBS 122681]|uniref:CHY-type domain-containing protein n=1 Tax=Lophiostoma macrostomum CBS 122681 TaxID=1314788 RepID=A0A6A6STL3_9PLEO|nr:hypothetical protein K491DRAFT_697336 [Lophiostoma macrostomum CBS 122681]